MIRFEIKKLIDKKVLVAIIVLFIVNVCYILFSNYNEISSEFYHGKQQIVKKVEGEITQDKVDFLLNGLEKNRNLVDAGNYNSEQKDENTYTGYVFGDMNAFEEVYMDLKRVYDYSSEIDDKISIIDENIEKSNNANKYSLFLKNQLEGRYISSYYDTQGIESYLNYSYSIIFIIILIVFSGINYLYYDQNYDMEKMIYITKNGNHKLQIAKYIVMIIFTILVSLLFFLCDFACFYLMYGIDGLTNPIYSLPSFVVSYFEIPIFIFVLLNVLLKITGILCICCFLIFLSKKIKLSYITIILCFMASIFLWQYIYIYISKDSWLSILNISKTFSIHKILSYYVHDIFIVAIGLCVTFVGMSYLCLRKGKNR